MRFACTFNTPLTVNGERPPLGRYKEAGNFTIMENGIAGGNASSSTFEERDYKSIFKLPSSRSNRHLTV